MGSPEGTAVVAAAVKPSLVKKLVEVMACIDRIPKSGHNTFHNYDYTTEADVCEAVRAELAKRCVIILPSCIDSKETPVGEKGQRVFTLKMRLTAHDGETGESLSWDMYGQGSDSLDKGAFKAITGAVKYGLLKPFLVPTGDDPERDEPGKGSVTPPPPAGTAGLKARMNTPPPATGRAPKTVFPNYGTLKGQPIHGAPLKDLQYYRNGALKTLGDPTKANFHAKERALIAAIDAEIAEQSAGQQAPDDNEPPPPGDEDAPF